MDFRNGYPSSKATFFISARMLLFMLLLAGATGSAVSFKLSNQRKGTIGHHQMVTRSAGMNYFESVDGAPRLIGGTAPAMVREAQYWMATLFASLSCLVLLRIPLRLARAGF